MGAGCVNAVSDASAAAVVQLASTTYTYTYAGANQTHPAICCVTGGIDLSLRSDNNHPDRPAAGDSHNEHQAVSLDEDPAFLQMDGQGG